MKDCENELLYKKEAQTIGLTAFALYLFTLPYVFIVTMNLNLISIRWIARAPWYDLAYSLLIGNLPLITQIVCLLALVVLGIRKNHKKVLVVSVLPALTLVLCVAAESILRAIL